jgi:hypothetical protein
MILTRRVLLKSASLGAAGVAGVLLARAYGGGRRRSDRRTIVSSDQYLLVVEETPPQVGVLVVKARARIGATIPIAENLWWYLDVRKIDETTAKMATVEFREYKHQTFHHAVGEIANPTFVERIENVPAGRYNVLVGLRERRGVRHLDGTRTPYSEGVASNQTLIVR